MQGAEEHHGPMLYRCDRYVSRWASQGPDWQQNVRAIAKTLEALRAVDRYGASSSGEQYAGYRQIASTSSPGPGPLATALARLREIAGTQADRRAHPDRGGSNELWAEVDDLVHAIGGDR